MAQVVLEFIGDPTGLKPVADALQAIGKLTKDQVAAFQKANADFASRSKTENAAIAKSFDDLSRKAKQIPQVLAGANFKEFMKGFQEGVIDGLKEFGFEVDKVAGKSKTMIGELRALKQQLASMDEGSAEFEKVAIQAAKLEDKIGDVRERVRVLASDTFHFDAAVGAVRGIAAAFTFAQSASALFGDESEELQKALLKVQAATGLLVSVQELANLVTGQGAAKLAVMGAAQRAYSFSVGTSVGALKAFRLALLATGIGAAVVGIGLLVTYWDDLTEAIFGASEAEKQEAQAQRERQKAREAEIHSIQQQIEFQKALGNSTEELTKKLFQAQKVNAALALDFNRVLQLIHEEIIFDIDTQISKEQELFNELKKTADLKLEIAEEGSAEELQLRIGLINLQKEHTLNTEKLTAEQRVLINAAANKQILNLQKEAATKGLEFTAKFNPNLSEEEEKKAAEKVVKSLEDGMKTVLSSKPLLVPAGEIEIPEPTISTKTKHKLGEAIKDAFAEVGLQDFLTDQAVVLFDTLFEISGENRDREFEAEIAALERRKEAALSAHDLTESQKQAIEDKFRKQQNAIKVKQFKADQNAAIADAAINAAVGATKTIANLGFPAAIPALVAQAIAILSQVAIIKAQKPPAFRMGTKGAPGGWALVGEEGPEFVNLPRGSKVVTHPETKRMLSGANIDDILLKYQLPALQNNFAMPNVDPAITRTIERESRFAQFDYNRLGRAIATHAKQVHVNIDEQGFSINLQQRNLNRVIINKRYSSD